MSSQKSAPISRDIMSSGAERQSKDSATAQDAQSDNRSSDDQIRDAKRTPGPTKRQKVKRHCSRWKWWYLLAVVILLAILLPIFFKVVIPEIIKNLLEKQAIPVNSGLLQAVSPTHINMSISTSLDTPLGVKLDPVELYLYNEDTTPMSPFLKLHLPEQHVNGKTEIAVANQTLEVSNQTELATWLDQYFDQLTSKLSLRGDPKIHLGALQYSSTLDKTIDIPALDYLNGFTILSQEFMLKSDNTEFNMKGELNIPNPGAFALGLGNVTFNVESGNVRLGLIHVYDVRLMPGNNSIPFNAEIYFDELVPNLSAVLDSQKEALGHGHLEIFATGNSTIINGEHIGYVEGVMNRKRLRITIPIITLLTDVVSGILGADQASLLNVFGEAIGNSTLFENLLDRWENEGSGRNSTMMRNLPKRHKAGRPWMLNLLRLGLRPRKA